MYKKVCRTHQYVEKVDRKYWSIIDYVLQMIHGRYNESLDILLKCRKYNLENKKQ